MKNNKPDISLLRKYLNGELDARAMYEIERQAQDDPILMDVMLGMENGRKETDEADLNEIKVRIKKRTGMQAEERKNIKLFPWKTWTVAASLAFAFLMAGLWFFRTPEKIQLHQSAGVQQKPETEVLRKTDTPNTIPEIKPPFPSRDGDLAANRSVLAKRTSKRKSIPEVAGAPAPAAVVMAASSMALKDTSAAEQALDGVTVTGYAAAKKAAVAYSTQTIKADMLPQVLTGKISGIQIRGRASVRAKSKNTAPEIGWKAYHQYLEEQGVIQSGNGGKVTLTFMLDEDGKPVSIKILKSVNAELDQKAIRIVADGPKWSRDEANPFKEITLKVKFHQ